MDCLRLFWLNGALLNNNTVACYDRMIPQLTSLLLQSLGLPKPTTRCSVLLNKNMKHHIKTTAGIIEEFYQHSSQTPKFGEGQGKASSPPNWLFLSSTLLAALHAICSGISLTSTCN
eukprot:15340713-Ditylum_brightwellii.AAC.1